ncbi:MAG: PA14 domain-containing protein [Elusimicrobiota bacterium]
MEETNNLIKKATLVLDSAFAMLHQDPSTAKLLIFRTIIILKRTYEGIRIGTNDDQQYEIPNTSIIYEDYVQELFKTSLIDLEKISISDSTLKITLIQTKDELEKLKKELGLNSLKKYKNKILKIFLSNFFLKKILPTLVFSFTSLFVIKIVYHHVIDKKHGLTTEYFSDHNLLSRTFVNHNREIDFDWGYSGPLPNGQADFFSIRWESYLFVPEDNEYSFITLSDDGVRLWINDFLLIDDWINHPPIYNENKIRLPKGFHKFKLEYYEYDLTAGVRVFWRPLTSKKKEIIKQKFFYLENPIKG